jgi:hypothetical protein
MEIRSDIRVALKLRMVRFLITPFRSRVSLTVPGTESNAANTSGPGRPQRWPTPPLHLIQTRLGRASSGVRLVISDDHRGLVKAVGEQLWVLPGSAVASTSPGTPATSSMPDGPPRSPRPGPSPLTLPMRPIPSASSADHPRRPRSRQRSGSTRRRQRRRHLSSSHDRVSHGA